MAAYCASQATVNQLDKLQSKPWIFRPGSLRMASGSSVSPLHLQRPSLDVRWPAVPHAQAATGIQTEERAGTLANHTEARREWPLTVCTVCMAAYCPSLSAVNQLHAPGEVQDLQAGQLANGRGQFLRSLAPAAAQP